MGILDVLQGFSNNGAAQQGLLAAGLGMLANNRGGVSTGEALGRGGLLGMNAYNSAGQAQRQAEQDKLKAAMMQQQMQQVDAETQMKQQQLAQAMRSETQKQAMVAKLFPDLAGAVATPALDAGTPAMLSNAGGSALSGAMGGAGQATSAAPLPMQAAAAAAPAAGGQAGGSAADPLAGLSASQRARMGLDLTFNGGKGMADIAKPDMSIQNGIVVDMNKMQPGQTLPTTTPDGQAIQWQPIGNGQYKLTIPQGSQDVMREQLKIKADSAAQNAWREVAGPNGSRVLKTEAQLKAENGGGGIPLQQPPQVAQAYQLGNEDFMKRAYTPTMDAGDSAATDLDQIRTLRNLPADTGATKEWQGKAASFLGALGIPQAEKYAGDQQKFQNVAMTKLQQNLAAQKGPQTEGDAQRAGKTFASLANTPDANKFIEDFAEAQALQKQRKADFYRDALPLAQKTGDLAEIDRRWRAIQGSIWNYPVLKKWAQEKGQ